LTQKGVCCIEMGRRLVVWRCLPKIERGKEIRMIWAEGSRGIREKEMWSKKQAVWEKKERGVASRGLSGFWQGKRIKTETAKPPKKEGSRERIVGNETTRERKKLTFCE